MPIFRTYKELEELAIPHKGGMCDSCYYENEPLHVCQNLECGGGIYVEKDPALVRIDQLEEKIANMMEKGKQLAKNNQELRELVKPLIQRNDDLLEANKRLKEKLKGSGIIHLDCGEGGAYAVFEGQADIARQKGCKCVYGAGNKIQVDIDSPEQMKELMRRLDILLELSAEWSADPEFEFNILSIKDSSSGGCHKHVTLEASRDLNQAERVLFQTFFCSDPARELYNTIRYIFLGYSNSCFFEKV